MPTRPPRQFSHQKRKLTPHEIVARCRAGAKLCKGLGLAGPVYSLQPPGVRVKPRYALRAIASGKLVPARDALFLDNTHSWAAK